MVVRILPYDDKFEDELSDKFKVEIFSFAIGEWRESIISCPKKFRFDDINSSGHFAHNETLYWSSTWVKPIFLFGLNPFKISEVVANTNIIKSSGSCNSNSGDNHQYHHECRYTELIVSANYDDSYPHTFQIQGGVVPAGLEGAYLQMCLLEFSHSGIFIWELKKEEDDLTITADGIGKLHSKHLRLDLGLPICFDPNKKGCLYTRLNEYRFKRTELKNGRSYKRAISVRTTASSR